MPQVEDSTIQKKSRNWRINNTKSVKFPTTPSDSKNEAQHYKDYNFAMIDAAIIFAIHFFDPNREKKESPERKFRPRD